MHGWCLRFTSTLVCTLDTRSAAAMLGYGQVLPYVHHICWSERQSELNERLLLRPAYIPEDYRESMHHSMRFSVNAPGAVLRDRGLLLRTSPRRGHCLMHAQAHAVPFDRGCVESDVVHDDTCTERKIQAGGQTREFVSVSCFIPGKRCRTLH